MSACHAGINFIRRFARLFHPFHSIRVGGHPTRLRSRLTTTSMTAYDSYPNTYKLYVSAYKGLRTGDLFTQFEYNSSTPRSELQSKQIHLSVPCRSNQPRLFSPSYTSSFVVRLLYNNPMLCCLVAYLWLACCKEIPKRKSNAYQLAICAINLVGIPVLCPSFVHLMNTCSSGSLLRTEVRGNRWIRLLLVPVM